jgi:hypothetical protein
VIEVVDRVLVTQLEEEVGVQVVIVKLKEVLQFHILNVVLDRVGYN